MSVTVTQDVLDRVLAADPPPFALLHRPDGGSGSSVDVLIGEVSQLDSLADVPLAETPARNGHHQTSARNGHRETEARDDRPQHDLLLIIPYRQIVERGFAAPDDGAPLIAMTVTGQQQMPVADVFARIPDVPSTLNDGHFDGDDDRYAEIVRRIVTDEIGTGEGANFVIKRSFVAEIADYAPQSALAFFCRLLERERGAYWTFVIHTGEVTLVGASPERHITVTGGKAVMNPISGTYRYPADGPTLEGISRFLADRKEAEELYMVVDEELKMMARICDSGGQMAGPYLKEMAQLAHTEYFIEGRTARDVREILRETMFAPTVTGSPLESASRVIDRYEPEGRGYYSGVAALIGRDADGDPTLDSAIMIRTAVIDRDGKLRIGVGATLVRDSDPVGEAKETAAKAAGLLSALKGKRNGGFRNHPEVRAALGSRNRGIARFWLHGAADERVTSSALAGLDVLVIDAEDNFTAMIDHQLRSLGVNVTVSRFDEACEFGDRDLVVMGPGPGDPRAAGDPKIARLRSVTDELLAGPRPFVAVCLSHQVLCVRLGLEIVRRPVPNQGVQREIDLFGRRRRVGFYNTFSARCAFDRIEVDGVGVVEVSRDRETGEVHALRGPGFASMQFHAESVLTVDGPAIVAEAVRGAIGR